MICLFPGWSQKAIRLLPCSIALLVSGCIGVTAVTGNLPRPSLRSCESNAPVPARVEIEMLESSAFQIMHRNNFDNSDLERKSKDAIALMLLRHIQKHPNLTNDPGANTTVRITLRLIDPGEDNYDSGLSSLSAVLGCFTLYVIPFYQETEEYINISVLHRGRIIEQNRYVYHHLRYLSWLMIPFQILYGFHSPNWGATTSGINYDRALAEVKPVIDADLRNVLCNIQDTPPAPELPTSPDGPPSGGGQVDSSIEI